MYLQPHRPSNDDAESPLCQELLDAIMDDRLEVVVSLVDKHPGLIDQPLDGEGRTAILRASMRNAVGVVQYLLDQRPKELENQWDVLLWGAAVHESLPLLELLVSKGLKIDGSNCHHALVTAAERGNEVFFRRLLDLPGMQALINHINDDGNTALHVASTNLNVEVVKMLLEAGADTIATDNNYDTPLEATILNNYYGRRRDGRKAVTALLKVSGNVVTTSAVLIESLIHRS